jgi:hypothetical protein
MRQSISNRPLPCGPALTAYEPETPLASELPNNAQTAQAANAVRNEMDPALA